MCPQCRPPADLATKTETQTPAPAIPFSTELSPPRTTSSPSLFLPLSSPACWCWPSCWHASCTRNERLENWISFTQSLCRPGFPSYFRWTFLLRPILRTTFRPQIFLLLNYLFSFKFVRAFKLRNYLNNRLFFLIFLWVPLPCHHIAGCSVYFEAPGAPWPVAA